MSSNLLEPELKLTDKQKAFIDYYVGLTHFNGTEAARLAGYAGNDDTLRNQATETLSKPYIRAEIKRRLAHRGITSEELLSELADIAKSPWKEHLLLEYNDNGDVVHAKMRLTDKLKAIELAGKALKMFDSAADWRGEVEQYLKQSQATPDSTSDSVN